MCSVQTSSIPESNEEHLISIFVYSICSKDLKHAQEYLTELGCDGCSSSEMCLVATKTPFILYTPKLRTFPKIELIYFIQLYDTYIIYVRTFGTRRVCIRLERLNKSLRRS